MPVRFEKLAHFVSPEPNTGCWLWTGSYREGYGMYTAYEALPVPHRYTRNAHRVVYEIFRGPILPGLQLDHLCRVRCCVNPDHLEPVTPRENILRGEGIAATHARRSHCAQGHPLVSNGWQRVCFICMYARRAQLKKERSNAQSV